MKNLEMDGVLLRKGEKRIALNNIYLTYKEARKIKEWLEEATQPRYKVEEYYGGFKIVDTTEKDECLAGIIYKRGNAMLEAYEAERVCERLNEGMNDG